MMKQKTEIFVNSYNVTCNKDQTTKQNSCINDLLSEKMNCNLPWTNQTGKNDLLSINLSWPGEGAGADCARSVLIHPRC